MAQNLEDLINALFDCVTSGPSTDLYDSVSSSLNTLGVKQPAMFLAVSHAYLLQHSKLSDNNHSFILNCITKVLEGAGVLDECDEQQALLIINLATNEMTMTKDNDEVWANSAKDILVTLAKSDRFVGHVMDAILNKYPPGHTIPPHRYVVLALASVSKHNATGFLPFLTDVLSRTVPLLGHLKQDAIRSAWSQALCCFCDAVIESYSTLTGNSFNNCESAGALVTDDSTSGSSAFVRSDYADSEYSDQFESIYEIILNWTSAKDPKCRADAAECVGTLCQMISRQRINRDLKKLVTMFLSVYKKTVALPEIFSITKGIANFLSACCSEDTFQVEHYLDDIFNAFFPHVCVVTEQSLSEDVSGVSLNSTQIKIRNEAFRCFQIASRRFADRQVYYLLHKMQNDKDTVKLGATNLMRHLLNSAGSQMEDKRSLITMGLKPLLTDETLSVRVKMSICQLCVALADHGYVHAEAGGQHVIQFLLTNLILKADGLVVSKKTSIFNENISLNQFHSQCAQALHTIANTCQSSFNLLWPLLFEYICVEAYTPVIADIFKCLRILTFRARESGHKLDFETDFDSSPRIAGPHQVMSRFFVCMNGAPLNNAFLKRATEALKVFNEIAIWFHESIPAVVNEQLPQMMALIEESQSSSTFTLENGQHNVSGNSDTLMTATGKDSREAVNPRRCDYSSLELKCARTQRWQTHILELLNACVCAVNNGEWRQTLAAAMAKQFQLYTENAHDKAFLMRCLGQTLSRITNTSFVVEHAMLMFRSTTHSNQIERVGCAMAIGHCAQTHTDLMLTELENVSKWEHTKKSGAGLFSFIKDAMPYGKTLDVEMIHLRATIVLCYGYVVYFCPPELVIQRIEQTVLPFLRQYTANCKDIVMREAHLETINLIALTVHPQHLNSDYKYDSRYECFSYIKQYVQGENSETLSSWVRLLAAKATSSLVQLEPPISDNELWDIGTVLTQQTFPIGREKSGLKTLDPLSVSGFLISPVIYSSNLPSGMASISSPFANSLGFMHSHRFPTSFLHHHRNSSSIAHSGKSDEFSVSAASTTRSQDSALSPPPTLSKSELKKRKGSLSAMAAAVVGTSNGGSSTRSGGTTQLRIDDDEASTVMDATVMQYRNAIGHIVSRQPFVETVSQLLKMFIQYYGSLVDHERTRAIDSTCLVLSAYAENAADCTLGHANDFSPLSSLLGRLAPRLADSLQAVRILSIRAIWLAFKLSLLRRGHSPQDTDLVDSSLFDPSVFIDELLGNEGKMDALNCRSAIIAISKEIEKRLPQSQVQTYISVLFLMLSEKQSNVSSSAAQLLSIVMEDRGHLLHAEAEKLVSTMLEHLVQVHSSMQTYTDLLNGFSLFASHQQYVVIDVLLKQPLPYSITNVDAWQIMARDASQFATAVDCVLDFMGAGANLSIPLPPLTPNLPRPNSSAARLDSAINGHFTDEDVKVDEASHPLATESVQKMESDEEDVETSRHAQHYYGSSQEPTSVPLRNSRPPSRPSAPPQLRNRTSTASLSADAGVAAIANVKSHYEVIDIGGGMAVKIVSGEACALIAALKELVKSGEPEDALFARIPLILAALLQMLVAVVDTQFPAAPRTSAAAAAAIAASGATATPVATNSSGTTALAVTSLTNSSSTALSPTNGGTTTISGSTAVTSITSGSLAKNKKAPTCSPIITPELCRMASTPAGLVADVLKTLLLRIRADSVVETMNSERAFTNITQPSHYILAVTTMCRSLCDHRPKFIGPLLTLMSSRISSPCEAERTACVAILSALVTRCPKENGDFNPDLFVTVIKALGKALKDSKLIVRKLAIRGHGLVGNLGGVKSLDEATRLELFRKFSKVAVDAALVGLDDSGDRGDQLAIEAVDALDTLVNVADKKLLTQILPQLLLRIRPCFEKENASLRAASFSLFAGLGASVGECDIFKESLHNNIVSVLLHLNDTDEVVQRRCAHVLSSTCRLLNSGQASTLVEHEIMNNKPVSNYVNFLKDFSTILAISFSDRLNYYALNCANYFKSQSARIRQNAALMTGLLLASLTSELRGTLSKDLIFSGLVQLLKDPDEEVRVTTARAISCLHAFS